MIGEQSWFDIRSTSDVAKIPSGLVYLDGGGLLGSVVEWADHLLNVPANGITILF